MSQQITDQRLVEELFNEVNLCLCGQVEKVAGQVYQYLCLLYEYERNFYVPENDPEDLFILWVLDSWGLVSHYGSVGGGVCGTEKGKALFQAMKRLKEQDSEFLPDPYWAHK